MAVSTYCLILASVARVLADALDIVLSLLIVTSSATPAPAVVRPRTLNGAEMFSILALVTLESAIFAVVTLSFRIFAVVTLASRIFAVVIASSAMSAVPMEAAVRAAVGEPRLLSLVEVTGSVGLNVLPGVIVMVAIIIILLYLLI
jgi:hypothetical protein